MASRASLVATLSCAPKANGEALAELADKGVAWLELRADLVKDITPEWLRARFPGRILFTLRGNHCRGDSQPSVDARCAKLRWAARHFDLVELDEERDLTPDVLSAVPPSKRLISWRGPAGDLKTLLQRFERISAVSAKHYRLIVHAHSSGDELVALSLLKALRRSDTIAYASGEIGFWSRLVAPCFGSNLVFGHAGSSPHDDEPTISQLIEDYGFPELPFIDGLFGIVGNPVLRSASPRIHNAAYRALGRRALFVPFHVESFRAFWERVVGGEALESLGLRVDGLTVVAPFKEEPLTRAVSRDPLVMRAKSCNVLVRRRGGWIADTTDPAGVIVSCSDRGRTVSGTRAAVIGCGGTGRAIAAALEEAGARVTLVNRGYARGERARRLLGLPLVRLRKFSAGDFDLLVNATPAGRNGEELFDTEQLRPNATVVDHVYADRQTTLVSTALAKKCAVVDGYEVLQIQASRQFRMMTGVLMPGSAAQLGVSRNGTPSASSF